MVKEFDGIVVFELLVGAGMVHDGIGIRGWTEWNGDSRDTPKLYAMI